METNDQSYLHTSPLTLHGIPVIELREVKLKKCVRYEAVKDGVVIATRQSNRDYVAALVYKGDTKIANGVGRMDLLRGALKGRQPDYIALLK